MFSLFDKRNILPLLLVTVSMFIFFLYRSPYVQKESFVAEIPKILPTPFSDGFGIKIMKVPDEYLINVYEQIDKDIVKHVADTLVDHQTARVSAVRECWQEEKRTKEEVKKAEGILSMAIKTLVFATFALTSIDPQLILKAIIFEPLAAIAVDDATKALDVAKEKHKIAVKNLKDVKELIGVAAEHEFYEKELDLYGAAGDREKREVCKKTMPSVYPAS